MNALATSTTLYVLYADTDRYRYFHNFHHQQLCLYFHRFESKNGLTMYASFPQGLVLANSSAVCECQSFGILSKLPSLEKFICAARGIPQTYVQTTCASL